MNINSLLTKITLSLVLFVSGLQISNAQNWQLVWSDEFNYTGLPDANKWGYDVGGGGWGNGEVQYYNASRSENSRVENGNLIIEARRDWVGSEYSSARLVSRNKGDWTYGRIEIRAKIPVGQGLWPAIWMLPTDNAYGGWPKSGEIDIMESFALGGLKYDKVEANIHTQAYNHTIGTNKGGAKTGLSNIEQNYHVYRVTWYANRMVFDVDGQEYFTFNNEGGWEKWPYDKRQHLIMNIAVGGALGTWVDPNIFPKRMEVDYVRVYQDNPGPVSTTGLVTAYKDCNYAGFSGGLGIGDYTTAQLNALGIQDNDISSLRITEGYKVIAYDGNNFTGNSITYTADNSCVGAWNDMISSVQIRPNGVTNVAGTYYLQNRNSGLYMDVAGGEAAQADGDNIAQWSLTSTNNQKFEFIPVGDGSYRIRAAHSGKMVDVAGGVVATADGVNIAQWTNTNSANQHFIVVPVTGGYYKLVAKHSGKIVEVAGASTAVGANIQQWKNNNQTCGQWTFKPVNNIAYNTGDGLRGDYYNGRDLDTWRMTRKDNEVNFNWGNGSPDALINNDNFSVKWSGKVQPRYTGTYTFHINSDNGRRLWVNNQLIINNWEDNWGTEHTGTIALEAGKKYDIVFEYFEATGGAASKLEWSSSLQAKEVIPQGQLFANVAPTASLTAPANNTNYVATANIVLTANAADSDGSVAKVEFYNGTTKLGEDASSPYSFNWNNVAVGTYTITARSIDNQGVFTNSSAITVKVNANQNPTVSITSPANNASFTAPATITINANAADADGTVSKVEFYNGATKLGEKTTSPYSYSWTNVAAGTYTLTAKAIDDKNGTTTSTAITVVVSNPNQAPTVSITAPANNATYIAAANVTLTATAADADGSVAKVEFYNGSTLLTTVNAAPYTYNWTNVAAGTYTITAKAYDNLGLVTTSTAIAVKVNANQNPTVSITSPANNASFTAPAAITITATAADADGTISKVEFYNGATKLGEDATSPYSYSWTNVAAGTYTLTAKAIDDKNGITTSTAITVVVSNANQAPTVSITAPANNATYVASANVTLTATAADADGSVAKVEFYNGSTLLTTVNAAPYTYNWANVTAGTYTITAKAYDNLGLATTSTAITVKVNANQLPVVSVTATSPTANAVNISATATDTDGSIVKVEYYAGTTKVGESTSSPYTFTWTNVTAGTYSVTAVATDDKGGKTTSAAVAVTVNNGNQAPTVSITAPANNATYVASANVTLTATAADADGSVAKVEFYNGSTLLTTVNAAPYTYNWTNVAVGTYTITAKAYDNLGLSATSTAITVKVNANQLPVVSVSATSPSANTVSISATATDTDGSIVKVEYYAGTTKVGESTSSPYTFTWTNVTAGTYSITAVATDDKGGKTTSAAVSVTVNNGNQAPTVSITAPANNATYVASANVTLTATASDADGSVAKVEFYNGSTLLTTVNAAPYTYNWTNVVAGTYTITAKAYDNLGLSATSTAITVKVNANQLPVVSVTATSSAANTANITATATDGDGSIVKVEYYAGSTKIGESTSSPYAFTWTNAPAGSHSITAVATDDKGGKTTSSAVTVTISGGNQAPTVSITGPADNAVFVASANISIAANASDADGSITKVEFYNGGTLLGTATAAPYTYSWTNVGAGSYSIIAKAYDNLGLSATSTTVKIQVNENQSPVVSVSATSTAANTVNIGATATDGDGSIVKIEYYAGTTKIGETTSAPHEFTWTNAPAGTHHITAVAVDDKGTTTTSDVVIVTVNGTTSVDDTALSNGVKLYPNPVKDILYFSVPVESAIVYDIAGSVLDVQNATIEKLDLNSYATGVYILQYQLNGKSHFHRIVKQ